MSPWALLWQDENYYLVAYDETENKVKHFRVDKMGTIEMTGEKRQGAESFARFDIAEYTNKMFGMFGGEETTVSIKFENELVGVVLDRFGSDVRIVKSDEKHFICSVNVAVSPHFLSWIMSFGKRAKIISPDSVVDEMYEMILEIKDNYDEND